MMSMTLDNIKTTIPGWTKEEERNYQKATIKAEEIEEKVNEIAQAIFCSPIIMQKMSKIGTLPESLIAKPIPSEFTSENQLINERVVPMINHLEKTGEVEVTLAFAKKLSEAYQAISEVSSNGKLAVAEYHLITKFLLAYINFLRQNKEMCNQKVIKDELFKAIFKNQEGEMPPIENLVTRLEGLQKDLDTSYLDPLKASVIQYGIFTEYVSSKIVLVVLASCIKSVVKYYSDNPLEVGIAIQNKRQAEHALKEMNDALNSPVFQKQLREKIELSEAFIKEIKGCEDETGLYEIAVRYFNQNPEEELLPPLLRLRALYTLAKQDDKYSPFFKGKAIELINAINAFEPVPVDIEVDRGGSEVDANCVIS